MTLPSATNASLQTTIGRITVLTKLKQAQTTSEMGNLWLNGSSSAFTHETPGVILRNLTDSGSDLQLNLRDAERARGWIADRVNEVQPTLTQGLIEHADLISKNIVRRSPAEFMALQDAWECDVIGVHAGHLAMERAAAAYPKLFPGRRITFLANDLVELNTGSAPKIKDTLDDRFRFIVNHVRDEDLLNERFGLTSQLVERSIAAGLLSTNPFGAMHRYYIKRAWLRVELGASIALVAGLVVGGLVNHAMDKGTLGTLLWILAFNPGLGFSAVSAHRGRDHRRKDLFSER